MLTSLLARIIGLNYLFFKIAAFLGPASLPVKVIDLNRLFFKAVELPLAL
jgi:hypothetical protein